MVQVKILKKTFLLAFIWGHWNLGSFCIQDWATFNLLLALPTKARILCLDSL